MRADRGEKHTGPSDFCSVDSVHSHFCSQTENVRAFLSEMVSEFICVHGGLPQVMHAHQLLNLLVAQLALSSQLGQCVSCQERGEGGTCLIPSPLMSAGLQ